MTFLMAPRTRVEFLERINVLCSRHQGSVTSWWRTEQRNTAVGGHENSKHLYGWAVDIVLDDMRADLRHKFMIECRHMGLFVKDGNACIHVQGLPLGPITQQ